MKQYEVQYEVVRISLGKFGEGVSPVPFVGALDDVPFFFYFSLNDRHIHDARRHLQHMVHDTIRNTSRIRTQENTQGKIGERGGGQTYTTLSNYFILEFILFHTGTPNCFILGEFGRVWRV